MSQGIDLLRMLEPAIRPTGTGAPSAARDSTAPIEQRGFDELLHEARAAASAIERSTPDVEAAKQSSVTSAAGPLGALGRIDAVENDALRTLLAQARTATDTQTPDTAA